MKKLSVFLALVLLGLSASIATDHISGGNPRGATIIYWSAVSIKLIVDMLRE